MEVDTTSSFLEHENSLKTHATLQDDVKEVQGVLREFSIIGDLHNGILKTNLREKQQEDRIQFRHVPKKVLDVFVGSAVYNHPSLDWVLRVRLPSTDEGRSALIALDPESPASSRISSLSECSPFASETSRDSPGLPGDAGEREEDTSSDSGGNIIAQSSSSTSTLETVTSSPEESTEKVTAQLDSKLPDPGKEKEKERTAEGKTSESHTGSLCEVDPEYEFPDSTDVRRCTSAKTSPSAAGDDSPCTKKEVRFSDAVGLDLESVKHIARGGTTNRPAVPPEQADLRDLIASVEPGDHENVATTTDPTAQHHLHPCFTEPGSSGSFPKRTYDQKVVLESVSLNDLELSVTGLVCVVNIGYAKRVFVRFTTDDWMNFRDLDAIYSEPANEGRIDKFLFKINLPKSFGFGSRLEFAVCYESTSQVYWDNNFQANYLVECR